MPEIHQRSTELASSYAREKSPFTSRVLSVVALLPIGGVLITCAGLVLAGTFMALAVAAPLFVIFSPILVPAVLAVALALAGFLTAGAFGVSALSSVLWLLNYVRRMGESLPEHLDHAGRRVQDTAGYVMRS